MNSSSASKVRERHSALVLNIGTFAEEDEAHELLNNLSMSFPFIVIIIWIFDALLAAVYLKWFHPWKILLQEVSSLGFLIQLGFRLCNPFFSQAPDQCEPETHDEAKMEQVDETVILNLILKILF